MNCTQSVFDWIKDTVSDDASEARARAHGFVHEYGHTGKSCRNWRQKLREVIMIVVMGGNAHGGFRVDDTDELVSG